MTNTFTNNYAENGGAVFIEDNADAFFTDSSFTGNNASAASRRVYAVGNGGAVLKNLDGITTFTNCAFDSNNANHGGGAISALVDKILGGVTAGGPFVYVGDGGDVQVNNSTFSNNVASEFGGALLFNARNLIVSDTNFTSNTAQTGGAASSIDINPFVSSPLLFRNCNMKNNVALGGVLPTTTLKDGGAVSSFRALTFKQVIFDSNAAQAGNGGAVTLHTKDLMPNTPTSKLTPQQESVEPFGLNPSNPNNFVSSDPTFLITPLNLMVVPSGLTTLKPSLMELPSLPTLPLETEVQSSLTPKEPLLELDSPRTLLEETVVQFTPLVM